MTSTACRALAALWHGAGLPPAALDEITLTGADPVLPSSFAVGSALQASLGAAALAAAEVGWRRSGAAARQQMSVDMAHAAEAGRAAAPAAGPA